MNTIEKLRARLAEIRTEAEAIVAAADAHEDTPGKFTDEQAKQFDALIAERDRIEADVARHERAAALAAPAGRATPQPQPLRTPEGQVSMQRERIEDDPMRGFESAADFGRAVKSAARPDGETDDRLRVLAAPTNFHRETQSTDGYMVPPAIRDEIWTLVMGDEGILSAVNPEPTESNHIQLPVDTSTPWSSDGIQANWSAEGIQFTKSRLNTDMRNVQLHKLHAYVLATEELLEDAPRLNRRLTVGASEAIRWKADEALVNGDGVGKPLGWFNSGALVTVAKESGQSADTLNATNVLKMRSRMLSARSAGAFWIGHQTILPQLGTMTIGDQPAWMPPGSGVREAPGGRLLGLPLRFSEHAQELGDKGDLQLVAPGGYYAAVKSGGIKFAASMHLFFDYDVEAFRWTFRVGGQPYLDAPIAQAKGSQTLSHFITLASRA